MRLQMASLEIRAASMSKVVRRGMIREMISRIVCDAVGDITWIAADGHLRSAVVDAVSDGASLAIDDAVHDAVDGLFT